MNVVFSTAGVVTLAMIGFAGIMTSPPDSQFDEPFPVIESTVYEGSERPLGASTSVEPAPVGVCPPVYTEALRTGFTPDEAAILDRIAWLESRCDPQAVGDNGQSLGILQIHAPSWCTVNRWNPTGYLQAALILTSCEELHDVTTAVRAAHAIYLYGGFQQWSTYSEAVAP